MCEEEHAGRKDKARGAKAQLGRAKGEGGEKARRRLNKKNIRAPVTTFELPRSSFTLRWKKLGLSRPSHPASGGWSRRPSVFPGMLEPREQGKRGRTILGPIQIRAAQHGAEAVPVAATPKTLFEPSLVTLTC